MNYWPADTTNLSECFLPVFDMVKDLTVTGARVAQAQYGAGGWVTHHNTDAWRGASVVDGALWGMWQTGGAWLSTLIWDHYQFTGDLGFLQTNYPAMKGAAQFFLDTLVVHPTLSYLVTNPSNSPELPHHSNASVCAGPTMDNQILRDLFDAAARASEVLGVDTTFRSQVRTARDRLPPSRVGSRGNMQEWLADWVETERTTGTSPTCTGCTPATRSPSGARRRSTRPPARPWSCAATTAPAGPSPGKSTSGPGWRTAPAPTSSSVTWCAPTGSRRTCSTCTRRSRSTATSAPPPASPRCCCTATPASCTCCRRCRAAWPTGQVRACGGAADTPSDVSWSNGQVDEIVVRADRDGTLRVRSRLFTGGFTLADAADGSTPATTRPETDVVQFSVRAGHTYRAARPGVTPSPTLTASPTPTTSPTSASPTPTPTTSSPAPSGARATYAVTGSWSGGFQGEVTVTAGATAIRGWTVSWTFPNGQVINQIWSGTHTQNGANVTVRNADYNGALAAGASTTFGFIGSVNGTNNPPTNLTCTTT